MTRIVWWYRLLWWQITARRDLCAEVARLRGQLVDAQAVHDKELAAVVALHDECVADLRETIAGLRIEGRNADEALAAARLEVWQERRRGNAGWQEAGKQRRRADRLQAERDEAGVSADA